MPPPPDFIFNTPYDMLFALFFSLVILAVNNPMRRIKFRSRLGDAITKATGFGAAISDADPDQKSEKDYDVWFASRFEKIPIFPPGYVFGLMLPILYCFIAASAVVFYKHQASIPSTEVDGVTMGFIFLIMFLKFWSVVFFEYKYPGLATVIVLVCLVSTLVLMTFMGKLSEWTSLGLLSPLAAWLLFAFILNAWFTWVDRRMKKGAYSTM